VTYKLTGVTLNHTQLHTITTTAHYGTNKNPHSPDVYFMKQNLLLVLHRNSALRPKDLCKCVAVYMYTEGINLIVAAGKSGLRASYCLKTLFENSRC
jgi:hypothetical protein